MSEASPSSSARFGALAAGRPLMLSTWSTKKRNQERSVRGEDDSRGPPCPWPDARKFLFFVIYTPLSVYGKRKCFLLVVSWHPGPTTLSAYIVNRQENSTRSADSWDVAAQSVFFCYCWNGAGFELGCGPSSSGLYFCSPCDQPSYFFLCENEPSLFFLKNTQSRPTYFSMPNGLQLFQDACKSWK